MKKRFLVVSPHPDDAELGIGGTIIKLRENGHKIFMVDLTSGEPTPFGTAATRKKETAKATKILGVTERANLWLENRYLFDTRDARLLLAEKIRIYKPDVILCPSPEDTHPDHVATTKIAEAARFYAKYTKLKLKGEPHYAFYMFYYFCSHARITPAFTFLVDISKQFKKKMRSVRSYRSQFVDNPGNRFIFEYLDSLNGYLGKLVRAQYAEAVYSREAIKIEDISSLL